MKQRAFSLHPRAKQDYRSIWLLVAKRDGEERADKLLSRIEAFCRSLGEFPDIGTCHDERFPGLRSVGIPGLKSAAVLFFVGTDRIVVLRVGYLGRDVWSNLKI